MLILILDRINDYYKMMMFNLTIFLLLQTLVAQAHPVELGVSQLRNLMDNKAIQRNPNLSTLDVYESLKELDSNSQLDQEPELKSLLDKLNDLNVLVSCDENSLKEKTKKLDMLTWSTAIAKVSVIEIGIRQINHCIDQTDMEPGWSEMLEIKKNIPSPHSGGDLVQLNESLDLSDLRKYLDNIGITKDPSKNEDLLIYNSLSEHRAHFDSDYRRLLVEPCNHIEGQRALADTIKTIFDITPTYKTGSLTPKTSSFIELLQICHKLGEPEFANSLYVNKNLAAFNETLRNPQVSLGPKFTLDLIEFLLDNQNYLKLDTKERKQWKNISTHLRIENPCTSFSINYYKELIDSEPIMNVKKMLESKLDDVWRTCKGNLKDKVYGHIESVTRDSPDFVGIDRLVEVVKQDANLETDAQLIFGNEKSLHKLMNGASKKYCKSNPNYRRSSLTPNYLDITRKDLDKICRKLGVINHKSDILMAIQNMNEMDKGYSTNIDAKTANWGARMMTCFLLNSDYLNDDS